MQPQPGYVYYVSDDYFNDVDDPCLMRNKSDGHKRPCYCCKQSEETGLYWMIPLSSQTLKFRDRFARSISKYGNCIGLVLGQFGGRNAAFLVQNAFRITENYVKEVFKINENPVPVHSKLQRIIYRKLQGSLAIHRKGYHTFYTDIDKDQFVMLQKKNERKPGLESMIAAAKNKQEKGFHSAPPLLCTER